MKIETNATNVTMQVLWRKDTVEKRHREDTEKKRQKGAKEVFVESLQPRPKLW